MLLSSFIFQAKFLLWFTCEKSNLVFNWKFSNNFFLYCHFCCCQSLLEKWGSLILIIIILIPLLNFRVKCTQLNSCLFLKFKDVWVNDKLWQLGIINLHWKRKKNWNIGSVVTTWEQLLYFVIFFCLRECASRYFLCSISLK